MFQIVTYILYMCINVCLIFRSVKFQNKNKIILAEEIIEEIEDDDSNPVPFKRIKKENDDSSRASSTVASFSNTSAKSTKPAESWNKSIGSHSMRGLSNLVRVKKPNANNEISGQIKNSENSNVSAVSADDKPKPMVAASGLSMLAGYSDSDSNNSADES